MADSDKDFAELLKIMQKQGGANNPVGLELGIMTGIKSCTVGELELDEEDLLIAEHLLTGYYTANNTKQPLNFDDLSSLKSCIKFIPPLAKGDTVLVQQVNEETYAIVERVGS